MAGTPRKVDLLYTPCPLDVRPVVLEAKGGCDRDGSLHWRRDGWGEQDLERGEVGDVLRLEVEEVGKSDL